MSYSGVVFAGTLGEVNVAASAAVTLLLPLLAQIDLTLFGEFGLGALSFDLNLQLQAALSLSFNIGLNISNPFIGFSLALAGIVQLEAQIQLALSGTLPSFSIDASLQLSFLANLSASISLQLGGLELLLQAMLAVKIPAVTFAASISAAISAGPLYLLAFESATGGAITLADAGAHISSDFATGLTYGAVTPLLPTDEVYGLVLVTKNPLVWQALAVLMLTS